MATPNFSPRVTDEDIEAQPQDEFTYGVPRACAEQCAGKSHSNTSAELWLMYLSENEKQGWEISEGWKGPKGDRDDVLMFTGLFSATIAIFLMESYQLLLPDLNTVIVASLTQMAQQLVSISDGALFQNIVVQSSTPFKPTAAAVRINVMWLLSLLLSLTYALSAARPYLGFAQHHGARHRYAHNLHGVAVDSMPTFLHLSVFLFIAGLIDFLLLINNIIAFCVIGYVLVFSFACLVLTASPSLYLVSPPCRDFPGEYH